jgi:hypothetical protein
MMNMDNSSPSSSNQSSSDEQSSTKTINNLLITTCSNTNNNPHSSIHETIKQFQSLANLFQTSTDQAAIASRNIEEEIQSAAQKLQAIQALNQQIKADHTKFIHDAEGQIAEIFCYVKLIQQNNSRLIEKNKQQKIHITQLTCWLPAFKSELKGLNSNQFKQRIMAQLNQTSVILTAQAKQIESQCEFLVNQEQKGFETQRDHLIVVEKELKSTQDDLSKSRIDHTKLQSQFIQLRNRYDENIALYQFQLDWNNTILPVFNKYKAIADNSSRSISELQRKKNLLQTYVRKNGVMEANFIDDSDNNSVNTFNTYDAVQELKMNELYYDSEEDQASVIESVRADNLLDYGDRQREFMQNWKENRKEKILIDLSTALASEKKDKKRSQVGSKSYSSLRNTSINWNGSGTSNNESKLYRSNQAVPLTIPSVPAVANSENNPGLSSPSAPNTIDAIPPLEPTNAIQTNSNSNISSTKRGAATAFVESGKRAKAASQAPAKSNLCKISTRDRLSEIEKQETSEGQTSSSTWINNNIRNNHLSNAGERSAFRSYADKTARDSNVANNFTIPTTIRHPVNANSNNSSLNRNINGVEHRSMRYQYHSNGSPAPAADSNNSLQKDYSTSYSYYFS